MDETKLRAGMAAHACVLAILIEHLNESHPDLRGKIKSKIDTVLGKRFEQYGAASEYEKEFRRLVMQLGVHEIQTDAEKPGPRKLTFRRRFLNWLQDE